MIFQSFSDLLVSHLSLGSILYIPVMGLFTLMLTTPLWAIYIGISSLAYWLYNDRIKLSYALSRVIRISIDGIFNPVAILTYSILTHYFFTHGWSFAKNFVYKTPNHPGSMYYHSIPLFAGCVLLHTLWVQLHVLWIKRYRIDAVYSRHMESKVFAFSRIFGAATMLYFIKPFSPTIENMLFNVSLFGYGVTTTGYLTNFYGLYHAKPLFSRGG